MDSLVCARSSLSQTLIKIVKNKTMISCFFFNLSKICIASCFLGLIKKCQYSIQYTVYSIQYTVYSIQYTMYSVHCKLYTVYVVSSFPLFDERHVRFSTLDLCLIFYILPYRTYLSMSIEQPSFYFDSKLLRQCPALL